MHKFKLFIDMDNTIYNLDKEVIDVMNEELGMNYSYKDNKDWWWQGTGVEKTYFENLLFKHGIFLNGEPIEDAVEFINALHYQGYDIIFTTAPQWSGNCIIEKISWLRNTFSWFNPDKNLLLTTRKELLGTSPHHVLIDDSIENLSRWNGYKICFATGCNERFEGIRLTKWCEIYNTIKILEKEVKYEGL